MKRAKLWLLGACAVASMLACGGVTQPLGDTTAGAGGQAGTQTSPPAKAGSNAGGSASTGTTHPCETECVHKVFTGMASSCKLCHGRVAQLALLDLESPYVTSRLEDVPAKHTDLAPGMSRANCPVGDKLIDTANPESSWLLKKVRGQQGNCGTAMPQTPPVLTASEVQCIESYVDCVAAR